MANTIDSIEFTGITNLPDDDRALLFVKVQYRSNIYNWRVYASTETPSWGEFLNSANTQSFIMNEIDDVEARWSVLDPQPPHDDYVVPETEDYWIKRKKAYPSITDQIGAIYRGANSADYITMQQTIAAVKAKYPKP